MPMRKAMMDAFLLGTLIDLPLIYTGVVLTFPLLLVLVYALVYLIALVLRLRKAATNSPAAHGERQASPIDYTAFTIIEGWMQSKRRTPPEEY